jgi:hypothetical protein
VFEPSCRCRRWKAGALTRVIQGDSEDRGATGGSESGGESLLIAEEASPSLRWMSEKTETVPVYRTRFGLKPSQLMDCVVG